ncbi:hypothetical protein KXD40_004700 [Peronospora effusa]|nr:hypothetical protein KXD40_004700 [Peronospora effusa]
MKRLPQPLIGNWWGYSPKLVQRELPVKVTAASRDRTYERSLLRGWGTTRLGKPIREVVDAVMGSLLACIVEKYASSILRGLQVTNLAGEQALLDEGRLDLHTAPNLEWEELSRASSLVLNDRRLKTMVTRQLCKQLYNPCYRVPRLNKVDNNGWVSQRLV